MKTATARTKITVGAFILAALLILAVGVLTLGDQVPFFTKRHRYVAVFKDAGGLQVGAPVRMGGLQIGMVTALDLVYEAGAGVVNATLEVDEPHQELIRSTSRATLQTQGVLGDRFISVSAGDPQSPQIGAGARIPSEESLALAQVVETSNKLLNSLVVTAGNVAELSKGLPKGETLASIDDEVLRTIRALRSLSENLEQGNALDVLLGEKDAKASAARTMANLEAASASILASVRKVEQGQGTLGLLVNDPGLYDDVKSLLGRANRSKFTRDLVRQAIESNGDASATAH